MTMNKSFELNIKKCKQGIDGINFEYIIQMGDYFSSEIPPSKQFLNECGKKIAEITCNTKKIKLYVNPAHYIRANNVQSFGVMDCNVIEQLQQEITIFIKNFLDEHLPWINYEKFIENLKLKDLECNITLPCVGKAKQSDVIAFFDLVPTETLLRRVNISKTNYKKKNTGCTFRKEHEYNVKIYDKSEEQISHGNSFIADNLLRVEIVFVQRKLTAMYKDKKTIYDILSLQGFKTAYYEYKKVYMNDIRETLIQCLNYCREQLLESLANSDFKNPIQATILKHKELIVDIEVLRKSLKKWYRSRYMEDNSKQVIRMYRNNNMGLPKDVLKTLKAFQIALG